MALSKVTLSTRFGDKFAKETDGGSTLTVLESSSSTVFSVQAVNTTSSSIYVKLYNNASATDSNSPDMILKFNASKTQTYHFTEGVAFGTALGLRCVTSAGTGGTGDPGTIVIKVVYD